MMNIEMKKVLIAESLDYHAHDTNFSLKIAQAKIEISELLQISEDVDKITPLTFDDDNVVEHLNKVVEFFDDLHDTLNEILDYMLALRDHINDQET